MIFYNSEEISIITGFSSLEFFVDFIKGVKKNKTNKTQHSKIYLTENFAMIGSSNFSRSSFINQKETNLTVDKNDSKFSEVEELAQYYWEQGTDFTYELLDILERI